MNHPLDATPSRQQQEQQPSHHHHHPLQHPQHHRADREDWHQYTLHSGTPTAPRSALLSPESPLRAANNDINYSPQQQHRYPPPPLPRQRYESLTGLLLESGASPSFGVCTDDESCVHMSVSGNDDDYSQSLGDGSGSGRGRGRCRLCCFSCGYDSPCAILLGLAAIGTCGAILGVMFPSSSSDSEHDHDQHQSESGSESIIPNWDVISNILGYTYFLAWTLSFYPQIITNWRHPSKARNGVSLDFVVWNIVGFACYAIYTTSFRYSDTVRREYAERFGGDDDDGATSGTGGGTGHDALNNVTGTLAQIAHVIVSSTKNHHGDANSTTADDSSSTFGDDGSGSAHGDGSSDGDAVAVPQVKANDVAFAWHALLLTIITFIQIVGCGGRGRDKHGRGDDLVANSPNEEWVDFEGGEDMEVVGLGGGERGMLGEEEGDFLGSPSINSSNDNSNISNHGNENNPREKIVDTERGREPKRRRRTRRVSHFTGCLVFLLLVACVAGATVVACNIDVGYGGGDGGGNGGWQWIDYLYFLSFVKVGVSIVKYIPQVVLNYRRKSTSGWQIWNILLDFSGGTLSIVQLVGDSLTEARARGLSGWTGVAGNPAKLGLGMVSIFFDVIFLFQHYVLYRHSSARQHVRGERDSISNRDNETPLLSGQ